jgi:hypothetical protein
MKISKLVNYSTDMCWNGQGTTEEVSSSSLPPSCSPSFSFIGGVGKKLVTKTWMWETCVQGHILSIGEDVL